MSAPELHEMSPNEINQRAVDLLCNLLEACTINLVTELTGVSRPTLYRWLDEDIELDAMDHRVAGWFVYIVTHNHKCRMLLERGPMTHPRLAKRYLESVTPTQGTEDNDEELEKGTARTEQDGPAG